MLIKLQSDNKFFLEKIDYLFKQKNIISTPDNVTFITLSFEIYENDVKLKIKDKFIRFSLPINFGSLFIKINKEIIDTYTEFGEYNFYPFQRSILGFKNKSLLSDIQNQILTVLIINKKGINKKLLYKSIWPKDKDISINKLDTHLTNLKNQIKEDLCMNINFFSHDKILKLILN